ncbi:hypothetical protein [Polaromonas sp.]|uniref:hypothetical protein n=1 Tax=Polaromonas sp. TaxID=1869339 RepID=UPI00352AC5ED
MNPASAQQAALRLLLEDVDPLLQRAEEATQTLTKVREELRTDLQILGSMVQQSLDTQPLLLEAARKLSSSAARIEAAVHSNMQLRTKAHPSGDRPRLWVTLAVTTVSSAVVASATIWMGTRNLAHEASLGRALMSVWPSLDAVTRNKVKAQLENP